MTTSSFAYDSDERVAFLNQFVVFEVERFPMKFNAAARKDGSAEQISGNGHNTRENGSENHVTILASSR